MELKTISINDIKENPSNPRTIDDSKLEKLVLSIKKFPKMLEKRPIVLNKDMIILGGNQRFKACVEAGLKEVPVIIASDFTPEEEREFMIKDNVGSGDWDWDLIVADWDKDEVQAWGVEVPNIKTDEIGLDGLFDEPEDEPEEDKEETNTITLEYTKEDYDKVMEAFESMTGSKEEIVAKLLGV